MEVRYFSPQPLDQTNISLPLENLSKPSSASTKGVINEKILYLQSGLFGLLVFTVVYGYLRWQNVPGEVNKSMADVATILIGLSMLLSSICYFWNLLDWTIIYRKYLGLVGFAFAITHLLLSWGAFLGLLKISTWQQGKMWPAIMGLLALIIFTIMALISNTYSARRLGGVMWKRILRTGYIAMIFVWMHVVLLKSGRWMSWYQSGMTTLPSVSLLVTIFIIIVVVMRILLWMSLRRKKELGKV